MHHLDRAVDLEHRRDAERVQRLVGRHRRRVGAAAERLEELDEAERHVRVARAHLVRHEHPRLPKREPHLAWWGGMGWGRFDVVGWAMSSHRAGVDVEHSPEHTHEPSRTSQAA